MSGASAADKKAFEASCQVQWPETGGECAHDYGAPCRLLSSAATWPHARNVRFGFFFAWEWGFGTLRARTCDQHCPEVPSRGIKRLMSVSHLFRAPSCSYVCDCRVGSTCFWSSLGMVYAARESRSPR